jgi:glutathione S-transferase
LGSTGRRRLRRCRTGLPGEESGLPPNRVLDWVARQEDKIIRSLGFMSGELGDHSWCMGTHFSLADVTVGCALGYLVFRFPEIDWQVKHPNLARLYNKVMQRPAFVDTVPQG